MNSGTTAIPTYWVDNHDQGIFCILCLFEALPATGMLVNQANFLLPSRETCGHEDTAPTCVVENLLPPGHGVSRIFTGVNVSPFDVVWIHCVSS